MSRPVAAAMVDGAAPTPAAARAGAPTHAARYPTTAVTSSVGSLEQAAKRTKAGIGGLEIVPSERLQGRLDVRPLTRRTAAL